MADAQDRAEVLDDDVLGDEFPPDEPLAVDDYGVTGGESRHPEPLDERVRRDEPDVPARDRDAAPLVQPVVDEDEAVYDGEKDLVADAVIDADAEAPGSRTVNETALAADRVPPPAEEVAMHLDDDPASPG